LVIGLATVLVYVLGKTIIETPKNK
jgi:hypothetical protein